MARHVQSIAQQPSLFEVKVTLDYCLYIRQGTKISTILGCRIFYGKYILKKKFQQSENN